MTYNILDKNGEEVRIPAFVREHLSPDLLIYQELYLGTRRYRLIPEEKSVTFMIYKEVDKGIYQLISENEYTWEYWIKHYLKYVEIVNWLQNNDYILVGNEWKVA